MANIRLENISKRYADGFLAVSDFNLDIADNEFIVFVGPSGCGKSTTLRMIAGIEEISEGKFYIDNKLMNDVAPKDRDIAMIFQNYALYPHLNVYDNMAFGLKMRKVPKAEIQKKVNEAAKSLDILDLLNRKPKTLSGGQRQRVAMGRAIVREPKVFLMDEPLSNLDAKLRIQMRTEIAKLHHSLQATVIYVTHDQTEAMTLGTRIVVMKDGVIQQVDSPDKLYRYPQNMFVAGFIGSLMTFCEADVKKVNNGILLQNKAFDVSLLADKVQLLVPYVGKSIIIGLRPEAIQVTENGSHIAEVDMIENLGSEAILYLNMSGISITAKVNSDLYIKIGDKVRIVIDQRQIHIFDKETGLAV